MIYIISDVKKSLGLEWVIKKIKLKYDLKIILINSKNSSFEKWLNLQDIYYINIDYKNKFLDFFPVLYSVLNFIVKNRSNHVHCHLRKASIIGLLASYILQIKKRVYTRHHGIESQGEILESFIDKIVFLFATDIITISNEIENITLSLNKTTSKKIKTIHHGFNLSYFKTNPKNLKLIKRKYKIRENQFVIGAISRLVYWKNIDKVIDAFILFKKYFNNNSILLLANIEKNGFYAKKVLKKLNCLTPRDYRLIEFEEDVFSLYKLFDIFIHIPKKGGYEAFGQTFIESMLSNTPTIFSNTGIAKEIGKTRINTYFCNPENLFDILKAIKFYYLKKNRIKLTTINARNSIKYKFNLDEHILKLIEVYDK